MFWYSISEKNFCKPSCKRMATTYSSSTGILSLSDSISEVISGDTNYIALCSVTLGICGFGFC